MTKIRSVFRVATATVVLFYRRIPYLFVATALLYGTGWLATQIYYRYAPASQFIHVDSATVANAAVGQELLLTLCRQTHYADIKSTNTRTFYKIVNSQQQTDKTYEFNATIEHDKQCQTIHIPPSKHPQTAGTYLIHTELTFNIAGNRKVYSYDTNQFKITDTAQSLEQQIQVLQKEIDQLRADGGEPGPSPAVVQSVSNTQNDPVDVQQAVASSPADSPVGLSMQPATSPVTTTLIPLQLNDLVSQVLRIVLK